MTPMRVVIADDEPLARHGIRQLLAAHADVEVIGEARDGREALRMLRARTPDVVFLDVQMPEMDGFEVLERLGVERMPRVIFVTAYDTFAVRAFETHAIDYLVKPVHEKRLHVALTRVREQLHSHEAIAVSRQLSELLTTLRSNGDAAAAPPRRLIVPGATTEVILDITEIEWIAANDYYSAVYARGRRHLIRESLNSLQKRLDATTFVRVHRSAIVNLARVREIRRGIATAAVVLMDGTRVPLSRRRREIVAEAIRRFAG